MRTDAHYDEFALFHENASEFGIPWKGAPTVRRVSVDTKNGEISALVWGEAPPELVLVHGGAQNAHTWDTVALALDRPLVAVDLPGHGHSAHRDDHAYWPAENAATLETALRTLAPDAARSPACRSAVSRRSHSRIVHRISCAGSCSST